MSKRNSQLHQFGLPSDGTRTGNPRRRQHLARLKAMRDGQLPSAPHQDFGAVELSIPELDYYVLIHRFPELRSPDPEIKRKAWMRLARSPEGAPYRVTRLRRGKQCHSITAR